MVVSARSLTPSLLVSGTSDAGGKWYAGDVQSSATRGDVRLASYVNAHDPRRSSFDGGPQ
jgi:hypothetical protein